MSAQQSSSDAVMASPERLPRTIRRVSGSRGNPLLLQEPEPLPFASKGHGALTSLIKSRSHGSRTSLFTWAAGGGSDDEYGSSSAHEALLGGGPGSVTGRPSSEYGADDDEEAGRRFDERRMSALLNSSHMRSMRLIGFANPRYRWERYWKTEEQLQAFKKPVRKYYERTNLLIQQYLYIDRLLDSSLPHDLVNEYNNMPVSAFKGVEIPQTILEEPPTPATLASPNGGTGQASPLASGGSSASLAKKVKRTPRDIYRPTETTPLFANATGSAISDDEEDDVGDGSVGNQSNGGIGAAVDGTEAAERRVKVRPASPDIPWLEDDDVSSDDAIVTLAIYVNFAANLFLLAGKIAVIIRVPSVSVLASLVDAVLDFLSTAIVWTTTWLISRQDQYQYPVGRRRLEPLGVLVFSIIMITSFAQVALEAIQRLMSSDHEVVVLGTPALVIMLSTIVIKGLCWLWCRLVKNSSVQALASDAATDVIFNAGTIAFPIVGTYARIWWLDALGGLLLSLVVMFNWSQTSAEHIKNLSGFSATADQRNILLYLTMRFAKTIKQIQGLQAYHSGDKLNVEVDIVLDASTSLKDSHDLSESLQYVLESVPIVDRAFVHVDYATYNLPTHMEQQARSK